MTEERLSGLAMLLIHRDTELITSPEEIFKPIGDKLNKTKLSIFILDCPSREHDTVHCKEFFATISSGFMTGSSSLGHEFYKVGNYVHTYIRTEYQVS